MCKDVHIFTGWICLLSQWCMTVWTIQGSLVLSRAIAVKHLAKRVIAELERSRIELNAIFSSLLLMEFDIR